MAEIKEKETYNLKVTKRSGRAAGQSEFIGQARVTKINGGRCMVEITSVVCGSEDFANWATGQTKSVEKGGLTEVPAAQ